MPILTNTFQGLPGGMDQNRPGHVLDTSYGVYLQDILLHRPGLMQQRGPLSALSGAPTVAFRASGIIATQNTAGTYKVAVLAGDVSNAKIHFLNDARTSVSTVYTAYGTMPTSPRKMVVSSAALGGGTLLGYSSGLRQGSGIETALYLWRGATKADYTFAHGTATRGSTAISNASGAPAYDTNVEAGMFVFSGTDLSAATYVGMVASVTNATNIVLEEKSVAPTVADGTLFFTSVRGLCPRVVSGTITTSTSTATVTGGNTTFLADALNVGTWDIFRAADLTYVGTVSTVDADSQVTLSASAAVAMDKERYIAIKRGALADYQGNVNAHPTRKMGFLTAAYAGRQFYANRTYQSGTSDYSNRLWFSDPMDMEAVSVARDGSWFTVQTEGGANTPITNIVALNNGLVIFKENELWMLVGQDENSFALRKIANIGLLHAMGVQQYGDAIVFASKTGIFKFDGITLTNLTFSLGQNYVKALSGWTTGTDQARSMVMRDHFFCHFSRYSDPVGVTKNGSTTTPSALTVCINLITGAITYLTNLQIWGSVMMPPGSGLETLYVVNTSSPVTTIADAVSLFDSTGADSLTCEGLTSGPNFFIESGRYDLGDPARKKRFKQLLLEYSISGTTLTLELLPGINGAGVVSTSNYAAQTTYAAKRIKSQKLTTHLGFRIYPTGTATNIVIGPWSIGYKLYPPGRI